ncbi:MAG: 2-amino-4-hydroxy-6-hydroxymethyldihydropteridine diphosphokinase [Fervidobacterium sp.]
MIIGIGNDVLDISRVGIEFERRILTEEEKTQREKITPEYIAGRFALKESYFKAIGTGLNGNSFQDISFLNRKDGSIYASIHRYIKPESGVYNFLHATLSHDGFAFASVVLEKLVGKVYIGIGTNVGDKEANIQTAIHHLQKISRIINMSKIIETLPYGKLDQPNFLNCIVEIDTDLSPDELLDQLLKIEQEMGRIRTEKWGPRIIDLDIIFYGNLVIKNKNLQVPHYDFENRIFFVQPMCELDPNFLHPLTKKSMKQIHRRLRGENNGS